MPASPTSSRAAGRAAAWVLFSTGAATGPASLAIINRLATASGAQVELRRAESGGIDAVATFRAGPGPVSAGPVGGRTAVRSAPGAAG